MCEIFRLLLAAYPDALSQFVATLYTFNTCYYVLLLASVVGSLRCEKKLNGSHQRGAPQSGMCMPHTNSGSVIALQVRIGW